VTAFPKRLCGVAPVPAGSGKTNAIGVGRWD
jgi:hypothetical protein